MKIKKKVADNALQSFCESKKLSLSVKCGHIIDDKLGRNANVSAKYIFIFPISPCSQCYKWCCLEILRISPSNWRRIGLDGPNEHISAEIR